MGGTSVLSSAPREKAWRDSGGGKSAYQHVLNYQRGAGGSFSGGRRGVPDVALDADPYSGYKVIVGGKQQIVGGTSASAPSWQGIWARAQGAKGGSLGFAGPVIYREPAFSFHDINRGTNGSYRATSGWDYTTGRGTPDIARFIARAGGKRR